MFTKSILGAAAVACFSTAAIAGACPPDQLLEKPRELMPVEGPGYDGTVAATIDLTDWRDMGNFMLRLRTLTIPPRGVVPVHNHGDRPAIVHIVTGELLEHNVNCAQPVRHVAGETTPEFGAGHMHWWQNPTDEPVMAISADVVPFESMDDDNM